MKNLTTRQNHAAINSYCKWTSNSNFNFSKFEIATLILKKINKILSSEKFLYRNIMQKFQKAPYMGPIYSYSPISWKIISCKYHFSIFKCYMYPVSLVSSVVSPRFICFQVYCTCTCTSTLGPILNLFNVLMCTFRYTGSRNIENFGANVIFFINLFKVS